MTGPIKVVSVNQPEPFKRPTPSESKWGNVLALFDALAVGMAQTVALDTRDFLDIKGSEYQGLENALKRRARENSVSLSHFLHGAEGLVTFAKGPGRTKREQKSDA